MFAYSHILMNGQLTLNGKEAVFSHAYSNIVMLSRDQLFSAPCMLC